MIKIFKLGLLLLGTLALSFTLVTAENKYGDSSKEMKSVVGKCTTGKKGIKTKCGEGKSDNVTQKPQTKEVPSKEKCGQGKCG